MRRKQQARARVDVTEETFCQRDPVATKTKWTPVGKAGASFCTHRLVQASPDRVEFRPDWRLKALCSGVVAFSIGTLRFPTGSFDLPGVVFSLVFVAIAAALYFWLSRPIVFDRSVGLFWKGSSTPPPGADRTDAPKAVALGDVHALQVISAPGADSSLYALNVVLKGGERANVVRHGNLRCLRGDATALGRFLRVPVWDVGGEPQTRYSRYCLRSIGAEVVRGSSMRFSFVVAILLAGSLPVSAAPADVDALLQGVTEVVAPGALVGPVAVFGENAFPVMTGRSGKSRLPILAAARYGKGRVVLAGHEGLYGSPDRPDQRRLILNTATWLAGEHKKPVRVLVVDHAQFAPILTEAGFQVTKAGLAQVEADLPNTDLLLISGGRLTPDAQRGLIETIAAWVKNGGGYFDAVPGWGWQQLNPALSLANDHGGNRLTARMGLVFADGSVDPTGKEGWLADRSGLTLAHAGDALAALEKHAAGQPALSREELAQVSATLTSAAGAVPGSDDLLLPKLHALIARQGNAAVPLPTQPLSVDNPVGRIACVLENVEMHRTPVEKLKAHPAAAGFPGAVPADAPRVEKSVQVDTAVPDWHSTGLYAAPGEVITVTIPAEARRAGLGLRIGSHTDGLWGLDKWSRFPEISDATPLRQATTRFGNPFGGIVYVTVPRNCRLGRISVSIGGGVQMPLFVAGETSLADWRTIRAYPAPWAELATKKIILTVPAKVVRELDDPEALMKVWDSGMDAIADLAGIPHERERPERMCCDQQISAGYMHSGYPIMTWLDVPPVMVDREAMLHGGAKKCWGFWHELGHNHQSGAWTFAGTGETTNNLFSLYCCEKVCGETVDKSSWLNVAKRSETVKRYFAGGAKFEQWCRDPGLSLMFYAQLQQAFGWDAFQRVFADYRAAAPGELPRSDDDKRDQFLVRFSRQVGRNLGPFFQAWGIPTSEKARQSVANLPTWLPKDFKEGIPFATGG